MCRPSRLTIEGRSCCRRSRAGLAVDAAASGVRAQGQGGLLSVSPKASCGRTALLGFVSSVFRRLRAQRRRTHAATWRAVRTAKPCGPGRRCHGQVLGEGAATRPTGAGASATFAGAREARRNSAPGRARHKPSDHRAGKAECWASPVCCCAVLSACAFRAADRGCRRHPAFPAPSWLVRVERSRQSSGEKRRENAKACLRAARWVPQISGSTGRGQSRSVPHAVSMERGPRRHALCPSTALPGYALAHCNDSRRARAPLLSSPRSQLRCRAGPSIRIQAVPPPGSPAPPPQRSARCSLSGTRSASRTALLASSPSTTSGAIAAHALDANCRRQVTTTTAAVVTNSSQGLTNQPR